MPPRLRPFQKQLSDDIDAAWAAGAQNVMAVSATGSGKTVIISHKMYNEPGASIAIAHRQELVSQIAIALARNGVRHRIVGASKNNSLTRIITALQVAELGYSFIDSTAKTGVGGVDTVVRMGADDWFKQVRLTVQDEGHHVLKENKWGRAALMFPNARGLFPTATPARADGRGLGRSSDGLTDIMVQAPSMRDIINMGYLTDYRIFCPPSNLDLTNVHTTATGEFSPNEVKREYSKSTVTGDIVAHYLKIAPGKLGVTFAIDVEEAGKIAAAFRAAGVPAEVVSANTPDTLRHSILRRFKNREILELVNVDLFGEGFDLPAIEVVSMGRPTDSFPLFSQQFGRTLRLMISAFLTGLWDTLSPAERKQLIRDSGKPVGIIIDHVGNVARHGLPDAPRIWTLDRRERNAKKKRDGIPIRVCSECLSAYEATNRVCPYCNFYTPPRSRGGIEFVDGDLLELDPETLRQLRGEITRIDGDFHAPQGLPFPAAIAARARWEERQVNQRSLRDAIAWWAGVEAHLGHSESASYRRFYFKFGIDVANAQTLGSREAEELAAKILVELAKVGIDGTVNAELYFANE